MALPDLFVVGAPKAGTTALHAALAGHPGLFMSPVKEPKFYLSDERPPPKQGGPGLLERDPPLFRRPRAGRRLPRGVRARAAPGPGRVGAVLALPGPRALR